jgi:hypothetical protein
MKPYRVIVTVVCFFILLPSWCRGEGKTGAAFLKMGVGARAGALGDAYGALADDATAIYWNPAGLVDAGRLELVASQNFWLLGMTQQYLAGTMATDAGSFGLGVSYSSSGTIPKIEDFMKVGEYSAYDGSVDIAYSRRLTDKIALGITGKYIFESIEEVNAHSFAADFGILADVGVIEGGRCGLSVHNVGPSIKFIEEGDPLPLTVRAGAAIQQREFAVTAEIENTIYSTMRFGVGGEYVFLETVALRAGYTTGRSVSAGIGVFWKSLRLDYAFLRNADIENTQMLSLRIIMDK